MDSNISLTSEFLLVPASLLPVALLLEWQTFLVMIARRKAGIKYPQLYAERAEVEASPEASRFNCVQRSHQNTLEVVPIILITSLITGLQYPRFAASAVGVFTFGKILYTLGYSTGHPMKRLSWGGLLGSVTQAVLLVGSLTTVIGWTREFWL